jgi:hypothetical protein
MDSPLAQSDPLSPTEKSSRGDGLHLLRAEGTGQIVIVNFRCSKNFSFHYVVTDMASSCYALRPTMCLRGGACRIVKVSSHECPKLSKGAEVNITKVYVAGLLTNCHQLIEKFNLAKVWNTE